MHMQMMFRKYQAIISYTTHHLESKHSVLWNAVEHHHAYRDETHDAAVERLVAMRGDALVLIPRIFCDLRGHFDVLVTASCVIRAKRHDRRFAVVFLAVRSKAFCVEDGADLPVHAFHFLEEFPRQELIKVSLAHTKKAESQA